MSQSANRGLVEQWYRTLAEQDMERFVGVHHVDCVYNISGHSPISGQIRGIDTLMEHVLPVVFAALDAEVFQFCTKQKIVCEDGERIVGIMEADGPGANGVRYDQRYVHMFGFRDGKIDRVWEFFDTALAAAVMFPDAEQVVEGVDRAGFEY